MLETCVGTSSLHSIDVTIKDKNEGLLRDICKYVTKWESNKNVRINHESAHVGNLAKHSTDSGQLKDWKQYL